MKLHLATILNMLLLGTALLFGCQDDSDSDSHVSGRNVDNTETDSGSDSGCNSDFTCDTASCTADSDIVCEDGLPRCGDSCVDVLVDLDNCGRCGAICAAVDNASPVCDSGTCDFACSDGFEDCDTNPGNGCEIQTNGDDPNNCGACGDVCSAGDNAAPVCNSGTCDFTCSDGFEDCDTNPSNGCEIQTNGDDLNNCGACGNACSGADNAWAACDNGSCGFSCMVGYRDCNGDPNDGCEQNVVDDVENCGECSIICADPAGGDPVCSDGECSFECLDGYEDCNGDASDGCEAFLNPYYDMGDYEDYMGFENCGSCGNNCASDEWCHPETNTCVTYS